MSEVLDPRQVGPALLVSELERVFTAARRGDLEVRMPRPGLVDPAAGPAIEAINDFLDVVDAFVRESAGAMEGGADGRRILERGLGGAFAHAARRINQASDELEVRAAEVTTARADEAAARRDADHERLKNAVEVSIATTELAVSSATILEGVREIQGSAAAMAAAADELGASVSDIEQHARSTAGAAEASEAFSRTGSEAVGEVRRLVRAADEDLDEVVAGARTLSQSMGSLSRVVDTISTIAEQTNLLALNATIEAARAGELGKGFAVVAGEVKALSRQTRTSTETIREQIDSINRAFAALVDLVGHARTSTGAVSETVGRLDGQVHQVADTAVRLAEQSMSLAAVIAQQRLAVDSLAKDMSRLKHSSDETAQVARTLQERSDANLELVEGARSRLARLDVPGRDLHLARADHVLWKKKVIDFAHGRLTDVDATLGPPDRCRLGRWLEAQGPRPELEVIHQPHHRVHHHGIAAARCFVAGASDGGFAEYAKMEAASVEVLRVLTELTDALAG